MLALNRFMASKDRLRSPLLALCVVALGLAGTGCSFLFVSGPPAAHKKMPYFDCTSSNVAPTIDAVLGAIYGIDGAVMIASGAASGSSTGSTPTGAIALGAGALFLASAVSGYGNTSDCREAKADLMERASRNQGLPGFGPAAPGPGFGPGMPAPYQPPQQPYDPWVSPPPGEMYPAPPPPSSAPAPAPEPVGGSPTPAPAQVPKPPAAADTEEPSR